MTITTDSPITDLGLRTAAPQALRAAVINTVRCGGSPDAIADEAMRQIELRYTLVPKTPADARCTAHPGITLVGGVCAACGPVLDDGGDPWD